MKTSTSMTKYLIFSTLCLSSCNPPPAAKVFYKFLIRNNSVSHISFQVSETYPDTAIPSPGTARVIGINPNANQSYESSVKWSDYFNRLPADTLTIFFYSQDTISKYGWQQVQSKYLILKRKDISFENLKSSNYLIPYP